MKKTQLILLFLFLLFNILYLSAFAQETGRVHLLLNNKVKVWKTTIMPGKTQILAMHRHEHDRVLFALNSGILKITNSQGMIHYLKLEKEKAYFLSKDIANEFHRDENTSNHPIQVLVVELID